MAEVEEHAVEQVAEKEMEAVEGQREDTSATMELSEVKRADRGTMELRDEKAMAKDEPEDDDAEPTTGAKNFYSK